MEPQNKRTGAANFVVWNYERHKCRYHSIPEGHIPVDTLTAPAGGVGRSIIRLSLAPATRTTGITRDNKWLSKYFQTYGSPNPLWGSDTLTNHWNGMSTSVHAGCTVTVLIDFCKDKRPPGSISRLRMILPGFLLPSHSVSPTPLSKSKQNDTHNPLVSGL